ncbi:hypothetical protein [Shinella sp. M31]|uniref:hypothetical protein n=1 Tax=Shinella sp. M31 TaxID=3368615 RepID=UPI003BA21964
MRSESTPVRGYGLTLYRDQDGHDVCGFLDGSPVLVPTRTEKTPEGRRIRFAEGKRELPQVGDIFCANSETAGLVRDALNEKFGRERDAVNAFRVVSANLSRRQRYLFLYVGIANMQTGSVDTVSFTLEAPDERVQRDGQAKFGRFVDALGLTEIADSDMLLGRAATMGGTGEARIFRRWLS